MQSVAILGVGLMVELHKAGLPTRADFDLIFISAEVARATFHATFSMHKLHDLERCNPHANTRSAVTNASGSGRSSRLSAWTALISIETLSGAPSGSTPSARRASASASA